MDALKCAKVQQTQARKHYISAGKDTAIFIVCIGKKTGHMHHFMDTSTVTV